MPYCPPQVEQLAAHTKEESLILTASVQDGTISHIGSETGKSFLSDNEEFKSQFLGFCLKCESVRFFLPTRAGTIQSVSVQYRYRNQSIHIDTVIMLYRYRWWRQPPKNNDFSGPKTIRFTLNFHTIKQKTQACIPTGFSSSEHFVVSKLALTLVHKFAFTYMENP